MHCIALPALPHRPATLDEILRFSVQELAKLFQSDLGAIFLLDEQVGELRLHRESVVGASADSAGCARAPACG